MPYDTCDNECMWMITTDSLVFTTIYCIDIVITGISVEYKIDYVVRSVFLILFKCIELLCLF